MSTPVKLRLYCSICARNDFYMDRIRAVADGLGLDLNSGDYADVIGGWTC